jgi:hypothetical protein
MDKVGKCAGARVSELGNDRSCSSGLLTPETLPLPHPETLARPGHLAFPQISPSVTTRPVFSGRWDISRGDGFP